jgi:ribosome biogenesis GTPase
MQMVSIVQKITGKHIFTASSSEDYPAVGDWVAIDTLGDEQAVIQGVLPRTTLLKRTYGDKNKRGEKDTTQVIAANIDVAFIIESVDRDYSLNRFERYFVMVESGGVTPAIILNKTDLLTKEAFNERVNELKNRFPNIDIIPTSTIDGAGLDTLTEYIEKGKTYCFLGSSGVGKSSLINTLLNQDSIKTSSISEYSGRGKHTTTARHMYFLEHGGIVIDNPGTREVGIADGASGTDILFDDIIELAKECKFADCTHTHEPGCHVTHAVASGTLDKERYLNYLTLKKETVHHELSDTEKREKNRQFGKFIKTAKKSLQRFDV